MNKKQLRLRIEQQVACEERAHKCVENLVLNSAVSQQGLEDAINLIMPGHYTDVTVERSISKLCGYPLCQNDLDKIPKQNFHISLRQKKIYNITERKLFCSNHCYRASKFLESQIPSSPLWLRNGRLMKIELLGENSKEEGLTCPRQDHSAASDNESCDALENHDILENETSINVQDDNKWTKEEVLNSDEHPHQGCRDSMSHLKNINTEDENKSEDLIGSCSQTSQPFSVVDIEKLCSYLKEWCTFNLPYMVDTFKILSDSDSENRNHSIENNSKDERSPLQFSQDDSGSKGSHAKKSLKAGREWQSETNIDRGKSLLTKTVITPPIDSKSQQIIRRRIVAQKLKIGFSDLLTDYQISVADFRIDIMSLIRSFRFTNQNVSLKSKEWKLMAAALLHGLACGDPDIATFLKSKKNQTEKMLQACSISENEFVKLTQILKMDSHNQRIPKNSELQGNCEIYDNDALD